MDGIVVVMPDLWHAVRKYERIMYRIAHEGFKPFYKNTVHGHMIGRMAEEGSFEYLKSIGFRAKPNFRESDHGADIILENGKYRVEVKSWSYGGYEWGGRGVNEDQFSNIQKKANILFWTEVRLATREVFLRGWSAVSDFNNVPVQTKGKLQSRQLEKVRPLQTLIKLLQ